MTLESDAIRALAIYNDASLSNVHAYLQENGFTLPNDGREARAWCESRAKAGDAQACYIVAEMFHLGLFGTADQDRALEFSKVASDAALAPALLLLASMIENQDEARSLALMEQSAKKGYAPAMYALALKYMVDGVDQASKEAGLGYLREAARHSYPPAQATLATHLLESGENGGIREGIVLMQSAAEHGLPHAHRMLAHYYQGGRYGLPIDMSKASALRADAARIEAESFTRWGLRSD